MPQNNEYATNTSKLVKFNVPEDMLRELAGFAVLDNEPINGVVNDAVRFYVDERRAAPTFPDELAAARARLTDEAEATPPEQQ